MLGYNFPINSTFLLPVMMHMAALSQGLAFTTSYVALGTYEAAFNQVIQSKTLPWICLASSLLGIKYIQTVWGTTGFSLICFEIAIYSSFICRSTESHCELTCKITLKQSLKSSYFLLPFPDFLDSNLNSQNSFFCLGFQYLPRVLSANSRTKAQVCVASAFKYLLT